MRKLLASLSLLAIGLVPSLALAQDAAAPMPEGLELLGPIIEAAQGGKWSLFTSLLIMILVWLATKAPLIKDWIKGEAKIWVAAVAGMLSAFATSVYVGHTEGAVDWLAAVLEGLSVGLAAGGLWSLIGRKIAGKPVDADGDGVLDSEEAQLSVEAPALAADVTVPDISVSEVDAVVDEVVNEG